MTLEQKLSATILKSPPRIKKLINELFKLRGLIEGFKVIHCCSKDIPRLK